MHTGHEILQNLRPWSCINTATVTQTYALPSSTSDVHNVLDTE